MGVYSAVHTQEVLDQLWVGHQWFRLCKDGVSAVLSLSQCFKIAQQYMTQPLGIHTWDLPLFSLLIFKAIRSEERSSRQPHHQHVNSSSSSQYGGLEDNI